MTAALWQETPDYDALVEELGEPAQLARGVDNVLIQSRITWEQVFEPELDSTFPTWPTVQDIWEELWPSPASTEAWTDLGYLSLPLESQDWVVGKLVPTSLRGDQLVAGVINVELPAVENTQQLTPVPAEVEVQQLASESS